MTTIWVVVGIVLIIMEIFTPGFYLFCVGVACFFAGLASVFSSNAPFQIAIFSVALVATMFFLRPVLFKYFIRNKKTGVERMIGKDCRVEKDIIPGEKGRVQVDGESWFAVSSEHLKAGEAAVIEKIEGTTLTVVRKN